MGCKVDDGTRFSQQCPLRPEKRGRRVLYKTFVCALVEAARFWGGQLLFLTRQGRACKLEVPVATELQLETLHR
jgi:hypothetical protein